MHARDGGGDESATRRPSRRAPAQAMQLGLNLSAGVALFTLLGHVVDLKRGGGAFWAVCGMIVGLLYGAYEVWKTARDLNAQGKAIPPRPPPGGGEEKKR